MSIDRCRRQCGLTLIELVMFMVIVSVGIAGILGVLNLTTAKSADPAAPKQALSIAEGILEEVELAPFTYCDPDDANAATATRPEISADGCATTLEGIGPEAGDARPFDNVSDYNGFSMAGIRDLATGTSIPGLEAYSAAVTVTPAVLGSITAADGDALSIKVTVTGPGATQVVLEGYRTRYAPNALP